MVRHVKTGRERKVASHFGSWVADCIRPGCEAFRVKNRKKTKTAFRQGRGAPPTDEPGPCEAES